MQRRTVILAAGDFPRKGTHPREMLDSAVRVVCCDGAADAYRRHVGREPHAVVGDCDSVRGRFANVVRIPEQDTNDLEKAVRHCRRQGWRNLVVVGATGRREDHAIGNVFRALDLGVEVATERGVFRPVEGEAALRVRKGCAISVFAPHPGTKMESSGLEWPLGPLESPGLYNATLNRATSSRVVLRSSRPVMVFVQW